MDPLLIKRTTSVLWDHLSCLKPQFQDELVQEIMINHGGSIWVERAGVMFPIEAKLDDTQIVAAINALANINEDKNTPILDCKLPGLRFASAVSPIAVNGPAICIRLHGKKKLRLSDYTAAGAWDIIDQPMHVVEGMECPSDSDVAGGGDACEGLLRWGVRAKKNFIISGGTTSGKTTLLNALIFEIPEDDRLLSIESPAELWISVPNSVAFEVNKRLGVSIRELVQLCLRFRGDRIIVGEVRGAEAFDLMAALATGHPGSAVSLHADAPTEALYRLETMIRMAPEAQNWPLQDLRRQIFSTFHYIVQAAHIGGIRTPVEIVRLDGIENGEYRFTTLFKKFSKGTR